MNTPEAIAKSLRRSAERLARYSTNPDVSRKHRGYYLRASKMAEQHADEVLAGCLDTTTAAFLRALTRQEVELGSLTVQATRWLRKGIQLGDFWKDCFSPALIKTCEARAKRKG